MSAGTPPRNRHGRQQPYIDPAGSFGIAGKWFGYVAMPGGGWRCIGLFDSEVAARAAVGLDDQQWKEGLP